MHIFDFFRDIFSVFGAFSRFLGVKFGFRKSCQCKRNDEYEVWFRRPCLYLFLCILSRAKQFWERCPLAGLMYSRWCLSFNKTWTNFWNFHQEHEYLFLICSSRAWILFLNFHQEHEYLFLIDPPSEVCRRVRLPGGAESLQPRGGCLSCMFMYVFHIHSLILIFGTGGWLFCMILWSLS